MRKLLFCCAAVALVATGGVAVAAAYAYRCPDSWLGHCACTACKVASNTSLLGLIQRGVSTQVQHTEPSTDASANQEPACCAELGKPADVCEPGCHPLSDPDGIVLNRLPGQIQVGGNEESGHDTSPIPEVQPIPVEVPPAVPETDPFAPHMPRCPEDEVLLKPMPQATDCADDPVTRAVVSFWSGVIRSVLHTDRPAGATEESEPSVPAGPANFQEDPHYYEQYPGCPYIGPSPVEGRRQCPRPSGNH